jgi:hypothetical protein
LSTSNPNGYRTNSTNWRNYFANQTSKLYAIVDSWNRDSSGASRNPEGAVTEENEANNRAEQDITVSFGVLPDGAGLNSVDAAPAVNR